MNGHDNNDICGVDMQYTDSVKVFTCRDRYDDMATCIYEAWSMALSVGHEHVMLLKEPVDQLDMFADYIHIEPDCEKSEKVTRSVRKLSWLVYRNMFNALLSHQDDALDSVYRYLVLAFANGRDVEHMLIRPEVMRIMELGRGVGNEAHLFREIARFTAVYGNIYICHIEPKDDVALLVADHFRDRMQSEHWLIVDDNREYAVVHPADSDMYVKRLADSEIKALHEAEKMEDDYTDMWRTFFNAAGIEQRENYRCQRTLFPLWSRKHATEFR